MRLAEKTAMVTGAAGGIGRAIIQRFIKEGANVLAVDRDRDALQAFVESLGRSRASVQPIIADASNEESCRQIHSAAEAAGKVDVLINNAGIYPTRPFIHMSYDDWRLVMRVNVDSVFLITQAVLPLMHKGGKIVNISSGTIWLGYRNCVHYATSKAALIGFTRALAAELGDVGISVNALTPGLTATPRALETFSAEAFAMRRAQRALKRDQTADDVAGAVLFLSSTDSDFMTGQTVNVDGGLAMH